jgi:hypothetical protein
LAKYKIDLGVKVKQATRAWRQATAVDPHGSPVSSIQEIAAKGTRKAFCDTPMKNTT